MSKELISKQFYVKVNNNFNDKIKMLMFLLFIVKSFVLLELLLLVKSPNINFFLFYYFSHIF